MRGTVDKRCKELLNVNMTLVARGTYICAHAWIFFKLCILITHYIQTMKMYLSN